MNKLLAILGEKILLCRQDVLERTNHEGEGRSKLG